MTKFLKWPRHIKSVDDLLRLLDAVNEPIEEQRVQIREYMRTMQRTAPESIKKELRERKLFGTYRP